MTTKQTTTTTTSNFDFVVNASLRLCGKVSILKSHAKINALIYSSTQKYIMLCFKKTLTNFASQKLVFSRPCGVVWNGDYHWGHSARAFTAITAA
jgi:hypothetical protein